MASALKPGICPLIGGPAVTIHGGIEPDQPRSVRFQRRVLRFPVRRSVLPGSRLHVLKVHEYPMRFRFSDLCNGAQQAGNIVTTISEIH